MFAVVSYRLWPIASVRASGSRSEHSQSRGTHRYCQSATPATISHTTRTMRIMRVTTALVTAYLLGLRPIRDMGLSLENRKANGLPKNTNRKLMKPKLRFNDFARGTRGHVEIVADVFNTSRRQKKDQFQAKHETPSFPGGSGDKVSPLIWPFICLHSKRSELDRCKVGLRKTI